VNTFAAFELLAAHDGIFPVWPPGLPQLPRLTSATDHEQQAQSLRKAHHAELPDIIPKSIA